MMYYEMAAGENVGFSRFLPCHRLQSVGSASALELPKERASARLLHLPAYAADAQKPC